MPGLAIRVNMAREMERPSRRSPPARPRRKFRPGMRPGPGGARHHAAGPAKKPTSLAGGEGATGRGLEGARSSPPAAAAPVPPPPRPAGPERAAGGQTLRQAFM